MVTRHTRSAAFYQAATQYIPGGVNSPVRAFQSVGMTPIFASHGKGALLTDVDQNQYIDYICSWGPLILGHCSAVANDGVVDVLNTGTTFGLSTQIEVDLAQEIVAAYPPVERVRMVSSGTEATMSAIRVARGHTGRDLVIKFEGCYHGHSDGLLVKSGSGTLTTGVPTSAGVPAAITDQTLVGNFNDLAHVQQLFKQYPQRIAAIIVEPIPGNMGLVEAAPGFLAGLRELCDQHQSVLIFDEVISGFRIGYGGATAHYGVEPDMICLGKIIGGGMPVGAYGGRASIMQNVAPLGDVYQAGTLSGNPLAMRMGLNVIRHLKAHPEIYQQLEAQAIKLEQGFNKNLQLLDIGGVTINRVGGMICQFFANGPVDSYQAVMQANTAQYAAYFRAMLAEGVLLPPAQYECLFLSAAHDDGIIERTIQAHLKSMEQVKRQFSEL